ncbi:MAG: riboflavin synthase [Spirochaetaceae bacterium]|nr:riboflavin synthase [Spirochaetaceae bacterium]
MFTGIIEETGTIVRIQKYGQSMTLVIRTAKVAEDLKPGDSLAVDGVCLTVTQIHSDKTVFADVTPETFSKTNFSALIPGKKVNLERAMPANGRFGGHIVTGHIDGTARLASKVQNGNSIEYTFAVPENLSVFIVQKGSVAVNGISLTVAEINGNMCRVAVIPHTQKNTTLQFLKDNSLVNLECDILGKYALKGGTYGQCL